MTTASNSDATETPDLPGFRVFGGGKSTDLRRFGGVFNALKIGAVVTRWEIFNALKTHGAVGMGIETRRDCDAAT